jgi:hypothetical protein
LEVGDSAAQTPHLVRSGYLTYGSGTSTAEMRGLLNLRSPLIDKARTDAEIVGNLSDWFPCSDQFEGLDFELWGESFR